MNDIELTQAEELDAYLSRLQAGQDAPIPELLPETEAKLACQLVNLAKNSVPQAGFAAELERQIHTSGRRKWFSGRISERIKRVLPMNKQLFFPLAISAVLILLIIMLAPMLLQQVYPRPTSVAQGPTPALTTESIVMPQLTSTEPVLIPSEISPAPTETPPRPTATQLVLPSEPPLLPSLGDWMTGGYGGGGGAPVSEIQYVLSTALPESPTEVTAYLQRLPEAFTSEYALQIAGQLGLTSARLYNGDAIAWPRMVGFSGTEEFYYSDFSVLPSNGLWAYPPHNLPNADQAAVTAQAALEGYNLLDSPYRSEMREDTVLFYHILDDKWPLVSPFARVSLRADGQIGLIDYRNFTFDSVGKYSLLTAQDAWQMLLSGEPKERLWYQFYPATSGNPRTWARMYTPDQQVDIFYHLTVHMPDDPTDAPFITSNNLMVNSDTVSLETLAQEYEVLLQNTMDVETPIHIWGVVQQVEGSQVLQLEGWDMPYHIDPMAGLQDASGAPYYWSGVVQRTESGNLLLADNGLALELPDLPADVPDGMAVYVQGGKVGDRLEWSRIQERMDLQEMPTQPAAIQANVEKVEFVYLAPQTTWMAQIAPPEELRMLMPVWRISGHTDQGAYFEVYVQAVGDEFLK
jgi:hypothetical protein